MEKVSSYRGPTPQGQQLVGRSSLGPGRIGFFRAADHADKAPCETHQALDIAAGASAAGRVSSIAAASARTPTRIVASEAWP